jgi:transposase, IS30 family
MNAKGSKHLSKQQRDDILSNLKLGLNLNELASILEKDQRTISREIKKNRVHVLNKRHVFALKDTLINCPRTLRFPHVCDGCDKRMYCRYENQFFYRPETAQEFYKKRLVEARVGINLTPSELDHLDATFYQGVKKGQSIMHIHMSDPACPVSVRTIYRYIEHKLTSISDIDLRRKVKLKKRSKTKTSKDKLDPKLLFGRSYTDFVLNQTAKPLGFIVQMDTVLGPKKSSSCLLTLHFLSFRFMIAFKLQQRSSKEITNVFHYLQSIFTIEEYKALFATILTDRGAEFYDPLQIEVHHQTGEIISHVYFCDPQASNQKEQIEENHTLLRYIFPKGTCFDHLTDQQLSLSLSHINSFNRKVIDASPISIFQSQFGLDILNKLKVRAISPDKVILKPYLLTIKSGLI